MGAPNLEVGRYAVFIWPAYAISAVTLLAMVADSLARASRWRKAAEAQPSNGDVPDGAPPEADSPNGTL